MNISITLTKEQAQALVDLINIAVQARGLSAARAAVFFLDTLEDGLKTAARAEKTVADSANPSGFPPDGSGPG